MASGAAGLRVPPSGVRGALREVRAGRRMMPDYACAVSATIPPACGAGPRKRYAREADAPTAWEKSYFWPRLVAPALKSLDLEGPNSNFLPPQNDQTTISLTGVL